MAVSAGVEHAPRVPILMYTQPLSSPASLVPFAEKLLQEESLSPVPPGRMGDSFISLHGQASALIMPPDLPSSRSQATCVWPHQLGSAQFLSVACVRVDPSHC